IQTTISDKSVKSYAAAFHARHGLIKVLGMSQAISVKHLFIPLSLASADELSEHRAPRLMEDTFRENHRRFSRSATSIDCLAAAQAVQMLQILGVPGSGKSTCLKHIGVTALENLLSEEGGEPVRALKAVPVIIELGRMVFPSEPSKSLSVRAPIEEAVLA